MADFLGYIGMALIHSNMIPQTIKVLNGADISALSMQTFIQTLIGLICFQTHAITTKNKLYIISNGIGMVNVLVVIIAILWKG